MRPMPELKVVEIPTEQLLEYPNNAKLHPHEQVDQIASSISEFGFNSPILAWHNDQSEPEIVAGHGRLMAAKKLDMKKLPVVFLDHMSDEQRRAYIIVDNPTNLSSGFDVEILKSELDGIADIDMSQYDLGITIDSAEVEYHSEDLSDKYNDTLGVFITCEDEEEQQRIYEEILEGGYECRLLTL